MKGRREKVRKREGKTGRNGKEVERIRGTQVERWGRREKREDQMERRYGERGRTEEE